MFNATFFQNNTHKSTVSALWVLTDTEFRYLESYTYDHWKKKKYDADDDLYTRHSIVLTPSKEDLLIVQFFPHN